MNWLDIVLLVALVGGAVQGLRIGLLGAAVTAIGGLVGWMLAGRFADKIGDVLSGSINSDRIVTVISYAIIVILVIAATRFVWKFIKPVLTLVTVGMSAMVDKVGGIVLGLILGVVVSGAIIILLARFTYNFELPDGGLPDFAKDEIAERIPLQEKKASIENALVESTITPNIVKVLHNLPGDALGFVPSDFRVALAHLEKNLE